MKNARNCFAFICLLLACLLSFSACSFHFLNKINTDEKESGNGESGEEKKADLSPMIGYWYSHSDLKFYDIREDGTVCRYLLVVGYFDSKTDPNAEFFNEYSDAVEGTYELGANYLHVTLSDGSKQDLFYLNGDKLACYEGRSYTNFVRKDTLPKRHGETSFPDFTDEKYKEYFSYDMIDDLSPDWVAAQAKAKRDIAVSCGINSTIQDRAAIYGDYVNITYTVTSIGDQSYNTGYVNQSILLIDSDSGIFYQLSDQIIGLNIDDHFTGFIDVPSDYGIEEYNGKTITVEGTLKLIYNTDDISDVMINIHSGGLYKNYEEIVTDYMTSYAFDDLWNQIVDRLSNYDLPKDATDFFLVDYRQRFSKRAYENNIPYLTYCEANGLTEELNRYYSNFYTIQYLLSEIIFEQESLSLTAENCEDAKSDLIDVMNSIYYFNSNDEALNFILENEQTRLFAKQKVFAATEWLLEQCKPE